MTATDELRRLLDERGVEYKIVPASFYTRESIMVGDTEILFNDRGEVAVHGITPEQAVEATLGRGECKSVCNSVTEFTCSECGFNCDLTSWISLFDGDDGRHRHHHHGMPSYCPNCGRKVVDA